MLERAAKAAYDRRTEWEWEKGRLPAGLILPHTEWEQLSEEQRVIEISCVRAAIEALREPDSSAVEMAISPYRYNNTAEFDDALRKSVIGYWQAIIDHLIPRHPMFPKRP